MGEAKADELVAKAEKKLKGFQLFGNKNEEALEMFEKAVNAYKLDKKWEKAALTYIRIADCHLKLDSKHECASAYVDAANAYKKFNEPEAFACLVKASEYFTEIGRFTIAAKHFKDMAEMKEKADEIEDAIKYFEKAADLYAGEEVKTTGNNCNLKIAALSAQLEDYAKAIALFEEVAKASLDNNLLRYSVKGYLLQAGLCVLCQGDHVAIENAVEKYQDMDASFRDSRECKLLVDLAAAMDAGDEGAFTDVVKEYDSMSRLDSWKTTLLLRAKKRCVAQEEDLT